MKRRWKPTKRPMRKHRPKRQTKGPEILQSIPPRTIAGMLMMGLTWMVLRGIEDQETKRNLAESVSDFLRGLDPRASESDLRRPA